MDLRKHHACVPCRDVTRTGRHRCIRLYIHNIGTNIHTWMHLHSIYGFTLPKKLKQRDLFFVEVFRGEMKPRIESVIK